MDRVADTTSLVIELTSARAVVVSTSVTRCNHSEESPGPSSGPAPNSADSSGVHQLAGRLSTGHGDGQTGAVLDITHAGRTRSPVSCRIASHGDHVVSGGRQDRAQPPAHGTKRSGHGARQVIWFGRDASRCSNSASATSLWWRVCDRPRGGLRSPLPPGRLPARQPWSAPPWPGAVSYRPRSRRHAILLPIFSGTDRRTCAAGRTGSGGTDLLVRGWRRRRVRRPLPGLARCRVSGFTAGR